MKEAQRPQPPPTSDRLRVVAEQVPPPSQANDLIVLASAAVAAVGGVAFGVGLLLGAPIALYGSALAGGLLALGLAVRRLLADRFADIEALEPRPGPERDDLPLSDVAATGRRRFLGRVLAGAAGLLGLGLLAPVVSLGPTPETAAGRTAWPEGAVGVELSGVMLLRLAQGSEPEPPTNLDWVVDGAVVAYSVVCTHAGCPVALFRERDNALFCPCHQSTFDVTRGAEPTFGPAVRSLPQLPLGVAEGGSLVALADFTEHVGPTFG